ASFLSNGQQVAVAERIPSPVFGFRNCMTCEKRNKWRWLTVIKQNAHRAKLVNVLHGRADSSNHSVISSMVAPASRFSNTADTGIWVSLNTHAPLSLPGTLSTAGHCDQSRVAMSGALVFIVPLPELPRRRRGLRHRCA